MSQTVELFVPATTAVEQMLITAVESTIAQLRGANVGSSREWTRQLFKALAACAYDDLKVEACYSGGADFDHNRAWLADFVMYRSDEQKNFRRLVLVAECEWLTDLGDLIYDFEKLLVLRANHRLFIFQAKNETEIQSRIRAFADCASYHDLLQEGDRCLFAAYNNAVGRPQLVLWMQPKGTFPLDRTAFAVSQGS